MSVSSEELPWFRSARFETALTVLGIVLAAGYTFFFLNVGWLPQDDGTLAQSALRVLNGQLPHRDFVENYTGGLSFLHALAFRLGGTNLMSLRICVFLFFLLWIIAVLYIARQFTTALPAIAVMLLAAAWSLPQYPAAMPSWYNLFFAGFGTAALMRYLNVQTTRWLFLAGAFGGFSLLAKITGLYYVAAVLLFLVFREQQINAIPEEETTGSSALYSTFSITSLLAFLACIVLLIRHHLDLRHITHFLFPAACLVVLLIARERTVKTRAPGIRFAVLTRMLLLFLAGVLLPVLCFLLPYAFSQSLGVFFANVVGLLSSRIDALTAFRPTSPSYLLGAAIPVLLLTVAICWRRAASAYFVAIVLIALAAALLDPRVAAWRDIWASSRLLTPLVVCFGAAVLLLRPTLASRLSPLPQQQLFLLLALAAMCSLVQFPLPAPIYFCYSAPLTVIAVSALATGCCRPASPWILGGVLMFFLLFGVLRVQPDRIYAHWFFGPQPAVRTMNLPRAAGLKVEGAQVYEDLTDIVQQHLDNGQLIATSECPEVYFLSGAKNATSADGGLRTDEFLPALRLSGVKVVVINLSPTFSSFTVTPDASRELAALFPNRSKVGDYLVCWR